MGDPESAEQVPPSAPAAEAGAPTPPALAIADATASAPISEGVDWGAALEKLGKTFVPASVVIYAFGYMIAVNHYTSVGVPPTELSHNTYIGAGLLFAAFCGLAAMALSWVKAESRRASK